MIENLLNRCSSHDLWKRRGAAVTMIYSIKDKEVLEEVFEIADLLFYEAEDLVQKGYGWMPKKTMIMNSFEMEQIGRLTQDELIHRGEEEKLARKFSLSRRFCCNLDSGRII